MTKVFLLLSIFLLSCSSSYELKVTGKTMGTTYSVKAYTANKLDEKEIKKVIENFLYKYNYRFSTYLENSEISLINQAPVDKEINPSREFMTLLRVAKKIYDRSNGMYDITVGPLVNRWGFGPIKERGKPSEKEVYSLRKTTGMEFLVLKEKSLIKKKNIYIDLSSIAKGDAVDKLSTLLEDKFRIKNHFVEIGGEVRISGKKPNKSNWIIGIEKPSLVQGSGIQKILPLHNESVATSGSYRNFKKYGDSIFSHVINPKTGYPVQHKTISVSVIAKKCAIADAWATAFMSIGVQESLVIAKKEGLKVYFLVKENEDIKEYKTTNFGY